MTQRINDKFCFRFRRQSPGIQDQVILPRVRRVFVKMVLDKLDPLAVERSDSACGLFGGELESLT
jgi:hypothetical protein